MNPYIRSDWKSRGQIDLSAFDQQRPQQAQQKKNQKGFWTDQISTGGGIGGALAGGAAGAAIGSAVPVVGTAIGGLAGAILGGALGSGGGEIAENYITGEQDKLKNVGMETLIGGATSMPIGAGLKVAQAGLKATTGIGKTGTRELLEQAGQKTVGAKGAASVATSAPQQNFGQRVADKMFAQAFTLPRRTADTLKPEKTARELLNYGVSGSLDKINSTSEQVLKNVGRLVDQSVAGIGGQVRVGDITGIANNAIKGVKITGPERKVLMERVTEIGTQGAMPGYSSPSQLLEQIRGLERYGYSRINAANSSLVKNPDLEDIGSAYVQVAKELEDNLYSAINKTGSLKKLQTPENAAQLNAIAKGLGDKFVRAKDTGEVRSLMAPFVRARTLVSTTMDEAQSAGSQGLAGLAGRGAGAGIGALAGGIPGAALGFLAAPLLRGAEEAVRAPIATTAGKLVNRMAAGGAGSASGQSPLALGVRQAGTRAIAGQMAPQDSQATSLEDALLQSSEMNQSLGMSDQSSMFGGQQPIEQSLYPRENLMYDIQRDPANAAEYIKHYQAMQELSPQTKLGTEQRKQLLGSQAAEGLINQIESSLNSLGASGRIGGNIAKVAGDIGLNDKVSSYEASRPSLALMLVKAIQGSAGQISDADRNAINAAIPSVTDTPGERQQKIASLRNIVSSYTNAALSMPTSLEDAVMRAGSY